MVLLHSKNKDIKDQLLESVRKSFADLKLRGRTGVQRIQVEVNDRDILSWLADQADPSKIYWQTRDGSFETGGVGIVDLISGQEAFDHRSVLNRMYKNLSDQNPQLRYFGGFCFDETNLDDEWKKFGSYRFWLPRFEMIQTNGHTNFSCNISSHEDLQNIENEFNKLDFTAKKAESSHLLPKSRQDFPTYPEWAKLAGEVIEAITKGQLEKVVLARKTLFHFAKVLDPMEIMGQVKKRTQNCFHFCFQIDERNAFLGASPERLYWRQEYMLATEAIAGTRPRGKSNTDDEDYQNQLIASVKDKMEHQFVVDTLRDNLLALCTEFKSLQTNSILKLKDGQHLISRFEGTLKKEVTDEKILLLLHPTPAVAGTPTDAALQTIRRLEPFKRGWYAGPVGWIGIDSAEFAVAIRSGLIQDDQLALYSGAGLVKGSVPEAEWDEIENKMSGFMKVFR